MTTLVKALLIVFGFFAYRLLSVAALERAPADPLHRIRGGEQEPFR
jgi:hypothetical protein